jgi:hypothetical protein
MSTTTQQQNQNQLSNDGLSTTSTLTPTKSNVKILSQDQNGDLRLKVFLLGADVNGNKWGIDPSTVEQNIQTAVGKPLVIYQDTGEEPDRIRHTPYGIVGEWPRKKGKYNHPPWDPHSIEHSREIQKVFAVGEIEKYVRNQQTGDYWGIVKITDDGLKRIFKENPTTPFYVSPQLWRLNPDEKHILKNWEFMHLAIVSEPAFGVRATVQGSCSGDSDSCTRQFMTANASMSHLPKDESGAPKGCGFCTYKAMKEVAEHTIENEKLNGRTIGQINNNDTSYLTNSSNLKTEERLSDNNNTLNAAGTAVPNATTISENVGTAVHTATETTPSQRISVEHKTYPNPETRTYRPNAQAEEQNNAVVSSNNNNNNEQDGRLALIARIEQEKAKRKEALQQLNILARDNKALATKVNKYENEVGELRSYMKAQQESARENGIAEVIYNANLADLVPDEKKEEAIKLALAKGLQPKEVAAFLSPIYEAFDNYMASTTRNGHNIEQVPQFNNNPATPTTANASLKRSRLTLGGSNNNGGNAFNASQKSPTLTSSEPAFVRARKLVGMYTPDDNSEVV